jgi:voltage-gated potassium channel Kch
MSRRFNSKLGLSLWIASVAAVILIGLYNFPREYRGVGFFEALYYTLRLFVFEHDLPSFPRSWPLILIYFAAPTITISAAGTAVTYLFRLSPAIRTRCMSNHVVVCGLGKSGKLVAATLKKRGVQVAGLDRGPAQAFEEWSAKYRVPIIYGDFKSKALLAKTGAKRARAVIYASGDDLANLEGAIAAYELLRTDSGPIKLIWTHIANEQLADKAQLAVRTKGQVAIRFFDTYHLAASRMINCFFGRDVRKTITKVTILGFGKFGRDLFEALARDLGPSDGFRIEVIDREDRATAVRALAEQLGVTDRVVFIRCDIQELQLVDQPDKAFFLCTDDDLGNLSAAMTLASKIEATCIYVRMAEWPLSAVADHLGVDRGVSFVNINELMVHGIEKLVGVFEPASREDIKKLNKPEHRFADED